MEWIACVACLSGNWSRLLLKSKVLWWWSKHSLCGTTLCNVNSRDLHPGCEPITGEDLREGMRFFLARVVSVTYQPWHLYTFHLCGCCCCEAPRFDRTIRVRWSHSLARLRPKGRGNAVFRNFNPHRWTGPDDPKAWQSTCLRLGLGSHEFGKDYLLPWFMTEIQFPNTTSCGFDCIYIWRHDIWYPCRLWLILMIWSCFIHYALIIVSNDLF